MGIIDATKRAVVGEAFVDDDHNRHGVSQDGYGMSHDGNKNTMPAGTTTGSAPYSTMDGVQQQPYGVNTGTPVVSGSQPTGHVADIGVPVNTYTSGTPHHSHGATGTPVISGSRPHMTGQAYSDPAGAAYTGGVPGAAYMGTPGSVEASHLGLNQGTGSHGTHDFHQKVQDGHVNIEGKDSKYGQAADKMVQAGAKLQQKKGTMGGKMDGVIDKAENALATAHDKLLERK
eukprot:jgi/Ulvmu1/805/UM010_0179.1